MDEVDEKVECFGGGRWGGLVGIWPRSLPRENCPEGAFQGAAERLGLGLLTAFGGGGGGGGGGGC